MKTYRKNLITLDGVVYTVRGGAWNDVNNSCFYDEIRRVDDFVICKEKGLELYFALYRPIMHD